MVKTEPLSPFRYRELLLLDDPERVLGIESGMTFMGLNDPYERASLIEYMCYLRFTGGHLIQKYWVN